MYSRYTSTGVHLIEDLPKVSVSTLREVWVGAISDETILRMFRDGALFYYPDGTPVITEKWELLGFSEKEEMQIGMSLHDFHNETDYSEYMVEKHDAYEWLTKNGRTLGRDFLHDWKEIISDCSLPSEEQLTPEAQVGMEEDSTKPAQDSLTVKETVQSDIELWEKAIANADTQIEKKTLYAMLARSRCESWKEIAQYLKNDVRTTQRWLEKGKGEALRIQKALPKV